MNEWSRMGYEITKDDKVTMYTWKFQVYFQY